MKNKFQFLFLASGFWLLVNSCGNNESSDYQLKGKLTNSKGDTVRLVNVNSSETKTIDSAIVNEEGEFLFMKKVPEKGFYSIQTSPSNLLTLILDSTEKISFEGDAKHLGEGCKVSGSKDSEIFLQFNEHTKKQFKQMELFREQQDSLRRVYEAYMNVNHDSLLLD